MDRFREPPPPTLDYAGRVPREPGERWSPGDETKSLAEGCFAMIVLALLIPLAGVVIACVLYGCLVTIVRFG